MKIVVLLILALVFTAMPAEAQNGQRPISPLMVYDGNNQVVGHYIGRGVVSFSVEGGVAIDAWLVLESSPEAQVFSAWYVSSDCTGEGRANVENGLYRQGVILLNQTIVHAIGGPVTPMLLMSSWRNIKADGSFTSCNQTQTGIPDTTPITFRPIGPPPYSVR